MEELPAIRLSDLEARLERLEDRIKDLETILRLHAENTRVLLELD